MSKPLKAFITYSHEDEQERKELRKRLAVMKRAGEIKLWDDTDITAGGEARQEHILKVVAGSDILLYLVSADSLASENCNKELTEAVDAEIKVIPIILESCDWLNDRLRDFQALPDKGNPINKWELESDGWQNVVDGIRNAVKEMQAQVDASSEISEKEREAELAFQHGNVLMMIKQIDGAIERYSYAIELAPNNATAYNNHGVAYNDRGEHDLAIEDFNKAIELKPNDAKVYYNLGNTYHRKGDADHNEGDYDLAIEAFTRAIELKPDYPEAYTNRGIDYVKKRNYEFAIADHSKAIELKLDYAEAYFNRGGAYKNRGDAYKRKGDNYHAKDDYDRAIADFTQAIELNPDFVGAYNHRGVAYRAKGDYDRAIDDFNKAIQLDPNNAEFHNNLGITYRKKGTFHRAIEDHNKAIECNSDFGSAYYNRGLARLLLKEWERAKSDLTTTKEKGANIGDEFGMDYESVSDFEGKHDIQLPADIAAMLTPPQA